MGKNRDWIKSNKETAAIGKHMVISALCKPISMIISYLYIPLVLKFLGIEKYGIWSTILTILSWISYFDIGIGNGLRNKLTESLSKKDGKSRKLVSSAYAFITVIMIIVTVFFSLIASKINWKRIFGTPQCDENLTMVVIVSFIFVSINFILSICKNVLYSLQKAANVSAMELMVQIFNFIGVLFAIHFLESNLFTMAIIYGVSMLIANLLTSVCLYQKNAIVKPSIKYIDLQVGKSITNVGMQFFIIQICALVLFTTDSLLISFLYGASDVTPYNTVNKLFNVIIGVYGALITPVWSAVTKASVERKFTVLTSLVKKMYKIIGIFVFFAIILLLFFRQISNLWLGMELDYSRELIICGFIYCILNIWTNMHGALANGLGILREQMFMSILQAIINIPLSLFLASTCKMKSAGILLGTDFTLAISCIMLPIFIKNKIREETMYENCRGC